MSSLRTALTHFPLDISSPKVCCSSMFETRKALPCLIIIPFHQRLFSSGSLMNLRVSNITSCTTDISFYLTILWNFVNVICAVCTLYLAMNHMTGELSLLSTGRLSNSFLLLLTYSSVSTLSMTRDGIYYISIAVYLLLSWIHCLKSFRRLTILWLIKMEPVIPLQ